MNHSSPRLFAKLTALSFALSMVSHAQAGHAQSSAQVVASYSVLCNLTEQIAEDTVDLACLIDAGQDPHTYSATPADRRAIEDADLVLYGGYDFEPGIIQMVEATDTPAPKIAVSEVAVSDPLMGEGHDHGEHSDNEHGDEHDDHDDEEHDDHDDEEHDDHGDDDDHGDEHDDHGDEEHGDEHDDHDDHGDDHEDHEDHGDEHDDHDDHGDKETEPDPHVWHDAENGVAMVQEIQKQLSELSPQNAALYETNATALIAQLEQLDTWIQTQVETVPATGRTLISTHDALGYYGNAYGIELEPALDSFSTEARPSAANIRELVEVVEKTSVSSIFVESTSNPGLIEAVSRETEITVSEDPIYADSLGEAGTPAASYQGMLMTNTCTIVNGLGGTCNQATAQSMVQ